MTGATVPCTPSGFMWSASQPIGFPAPFTCMPKQPWLKESIDPFRAGKRIRMLSRFHATLSYHLPTSGPLPERFGPRIAIRPRPFLLYWILGLPMRGNLIKPFCCLHRLSVLSTLPPVTVNNPPCQPAKALMPSCPPPPLHLCPADHHHGGNKPTGAHHTSLQSPQSASSHYCLALASEIRKTEICSVPEFPSSEYRDHLCRAV